MLYCIIPGQWQERQEGREEGAAQEGKSKGRGTGIRR